MGQKAAAGWRHDRSFWAHLHVHTCCVWCLGTLGALSMPYSHLIPAPPPGGPQGDMKAFLQSISSAPGMLQVTSSV
jgi:hypothetical protein